MYKVLSFLGLSSLAFSAPIAVDFTDATTSVTDAGTALVLLGVTVFSIVLIYNFVKNR